jgi:hypothetical protein
MNCAESISKQFDIIELIQKTIYVIPNTNIIYMDYPMFKMFANPEIYTTIVDYFTTVINEMIVKYNNYEIHLNLQSFTISAAERYSQIIELFCNQCLNSNTNYSGYLSQMYIYHSPSVIENIMKLFGRFIDSTVKEKVVLYNKQESSTLIDNLLEQMR